MPLIHNRVVYAQNVALSAKGISRIPAPHWQNRLRHRSVELRRIDIANHPIHTGFHVVLVMAVKEPVLILTRRKFNQDAPHRWHIDRMLERTPLSLPVYHPKEMAVQMDRMMHHR